MSKSIRDDQEAVYEISYLIAGVPDERVSAEAEAVRGIVVGAGASIIAEEGPRREHLAYTMTKKTVAGSYEKYDSAYFGWIKFEVGSDKIEAVRKAVSAVPSVLRVLLVTAVRESTYMGKRIPAQASFARRLPSKSFEDLGSEPPAESPKKEALPAIPATIEEMDKSIDEMVKEV